jgi:protein SCO1
MMAALQIRFASIGVVLLLAMVGCQRDQSSSASAQRSAERLDFGGDFSLTDQDGRTFRLEDVRGRPVFLFFGYTSCPDMCPMTMSRIMSAQDRLGDQGSRIVTLFVSVDPKRDTPAVLKEYVASFSTPLIGLTGSEAEIAQVAAKYHASFELVQTDSPNYLVNHTTAIFLIDPQGRLREYFAFDEDPERLAAAVRALLSET